MKIFSSHAKWILSGEHTVVRGGKAIAFPLHCYVNSVFSEKSKEFSVNSKVSIIKSIIVSLFETASKFTQIPLKDIRRAFTIKNNIPVKTGLGSSAAISVNIANIFKYHGFGGDLFSLARLLENKFHGKSSGLDVTVVLKNKPIVFENNCITSIIEPTFWPHLILTYSGKKSTTSQCIDTVQRMFLKNEKLANELDVLMNQSSNMCEEALKTANFNQLRDGIILGNEVFHKWGLCNEQLTNHMKDLFLDGAVAAKPIGSGLGGYVVSLWEEKPKRDICLTLEKP
ncbi:MAG: hypothetical protein LBS23_00615 [Holosporaceae bacterium]|jgi:mevalonate kinase|nr:hypothetical protein [Holosporaceae bacterium]